MPDLTHFLAFDTSTDQLSVALTDGVQVWSHHGAGGAQASLMLIPVIQALLAEADMTLDALHAIVFGRGPGSFTGLRTACAVAQGLAFGARQGAGLPVLPVDTLLAVAEEARFQHLAEGGSPLRRITALLDARMNELYVETFDFDTAATPTPVGRSAGPCVLVAPEAFAAPPGTSLLTGNAFGVYAARLPLTDLPCRNALPTASALLRLAPALAAAGGCVDAALALPHYVRDKVASTTDERAQAKALATPASSISPAPN
jgi:tRNA threonylcarbamoyladenosine biosynthesis protein TsaB